MALEKLARELDETARQSTALIDGIAEALTGLGDSNIGCASARLLAIKQIIIAAQGQDRIEQRLKTLAHAVREMQKAGAFIDEDAHHTVWTSLNMDELGLSGPPVSDQPPARGDAELF